MIDHEGVKRDERGVVAENAGYKWTCLIITFALLIDVAYRAKVRKEVAWDLMVLVVVPGVISTICQACLKTQSRWMAMRMVCLQVFVVVVFFAVMYMYQSHFSH